MECVLNICHEKYKLFGEVVFLEKWETFQVYYSLYSLYIQYKLNFLHHMKNKKANVAFFRLFVCHKWPDFGLTLFKHTVSGKAVQSPDHWVNGIWVTSLASLYYLKISGPQLFSHFESNLWDILNLVYTFNFAKLKAVK